MHPCQYVGRQGLNRPRSAQREALIDSVVIVRVVPLASSSHDFAYGRVPDLLVYMVTTYAALDPMYIDVVSCSSGHFGSCTTSGTFLRT